MGLDVMTHDPLEAMNTLYQLAEEAKREGGKLRESKSPAPGPKYIQPDCCW